MQMWRLFPLVLLLSLFLIPGVDGRVERLKTLEGEIDYGIYDSSGFDAPPSSTIRLNVWSDQSVYVVVMEPWDMEMFDLAFYGDDVALTYIEASLMTDVSGDNVAKTFDLPGPSTLYEQYEGMAYYMVVVGYGAYPDGWCQRGDSTADVKVEVYQMDYVDAEDKPTICCEAMVIFPLTGLFLAVLLLNLRKRQTE